MNLTRIALVALLFFANPSYAINTERDSGDRPGRQSATEAREAREARDRERDKNDTSKKDPSSYISKYTKTNGRMRGDPPVPPLSAMPACDGGKMTDELRRRGERIRLFSASLSGL